MPQAVGGWIATNIIIPAFWALEGVIGAQAAALVINIGTALATNALLGAAVDALVDIPDLNKTSRNNLVTTRSTIEHQRVIYGEVLVSGPLWYLNAAGTHNQALYHAVVVAGHEVEDMTDVWLDDNEILNASIGWTGGASPVNSFWPRGDTAYDTTAYFYKKLGFETQASITDLVSAFSEITTNHKGQGIAYFVARLDYFEGQTQVWSAGAPRNFRIKVKGKKVYDPRSDGTQTFGTGPHRVNDDSTWEWSDNPALCWADYMIDSQHGFAEVTSRIDYGYVASAAEWCDGTVYLPDDPGPGGTDKRYRCNGVLSAGNTHKQNLESILSSANMTMALVQGVWKLRPFAFETPTLQFTDDDLRGDMKITLTTESSKRYNAVRGTFVDRDRMYQPHTFPTFVSTEYIARDNSETIIKDIQLPMTTDYFTAQRLAAGILEQSDLQTSVVYPSNFKTIPVEIGGTIAITNSKMGWSEKPFRVTNYKLSDMKGIDLVLREDVAAAYTDVGTAEYIVRSGGDYVTADPGVPAPTSFWTANIPAGVELHWTNPAARLFEWIEIHRSRTNSFSVADLVGETRLNFWEATPPQNNLYYYWVRARNWAGEVSSPSPHQYSGQVGVYGAEDYMITVDPTFERSPINSAETNYPFGRFWSQYVNRSTIGDFLYAAYVASDSASAGTGDSRIYRFESIYDQNWVGPDVINVWNTRRTPVIRGMGVTLTFRYRVTSYTNVISSYITLDLMGLANLHGTGAGDNTIRTTKLNITNSFDWIIHSEWLDLPGASNVSSFGFCYAKMENWHWGTQVNTGQLCIEVDDYMMRWSPS